ncbi:MAG: hypothetical protein Q7S21_06995 [archaeon]|nr:hypothetical protein [archaeon]
MLKKASLLIFLIALTLSVQALTLSAPEKLVANTNWDAIIDLDSADSFTKTEVFLNNNLIITVFNNSQTSIDPSNGRFVIRASVYDEKPSTADGLRMYISFIGLNEGTHSISVKSFNADTIIQERTQQINVINPLGTDYQAEIEGKLDTKSADLQNQIGSSNQKLALIEERLNALLAKIDEVNANLSAQISSTNRTKEVEELQAQAKELQSLVAELKQENSAQAQLLESKLDKPKPIEFDLNGTGFLSLGAWWTKYLFIFLLGLVLVVIGFLRLKNSMPSSSRGIGYTFKDTEHYKDQTLDQMVDEKANTGRWGTQPRNTKENKKGYFAQDLIKKNP